jgi:hypothetical protein
VVIADEEWFSNALDRLLLEASANITVDGNAAVKLDTNMGNITAENIAYSRNITLPGNNIITILPYYVISILEIGANSFDDPPIEIIQFDAVNSYENSVELTVLLRIGKNFQITSLLYLFNSS